MCSGARLLAGTLVAVTCCWTLTKQGERERYVVTPGCRRRSYGRNRVRTVSPVPKSPPSVLLRPIDWTLLTIAAAGARPLEPVQLQKAMFLVGAQLSEAKRRTRHFYTFTAYDYGPFDRQVYADAEQLEREGWVMIRRPPETRYNQYLITARGTLEAHRLELELEPQVRQYLKNVVEFVQSLSFNDLVQAIYRAFPAMKVNSVFQF
jgi:hypothetical protein